jgi:hypothetical protein
MGTANSNKRVMKTKRVTKRKLSATAAVTPSPVAEPAKKRQKTQMKSRGFLKHSFPL